MKKLSRWRWADPLYDVTVVLLKGEWATALRWLDQTFEGVTKENAGGGQGAKTLWIERPKGVALVLWFPQWFHTNDSHYLSVLAHESFHAAEFVLRERGLTLTDSSDEAYAYYLAWIFRECHKRLSR